MFKKILVPLDLTDRHQMAVDMACELARLGKGDVLLLHVVETIPGLEEDEEKDFYARLERGARDKLARAAADATQAGVICRYDVVFGQRAHDTIAYAADKGVDLILLTSPPFDPDHPTAGLGSLSWKITMVAPCPVLVVKASREM